MKMIRTSTSAAIAANCLLAIGLNCQSATPMTELEAQQSRSVELIPVADTDDWGKQQQWIRIGKDAVRAKLKDSGSAKFKDVYFFRGRDRVPVTCGQVNAKNSFGGYSGFQHFVSAGSADLTYLESEVKDFRAVWNRLCTK